MATTKTQTQTQTQTQTAIVINQEEFVNMLRAIKGTTIVTLMTRTNMDKSMRKTGNPFYGKGVCKVSWVNGMLGWIYANSVNNQRLREDMEADFEPEPRKWGTRIKGTPLVEHKGRYYIELKVEHVYAHTYRWANGSEMSDDEVARMSEFFSKKSSSSRQGVKREVILRDYRVDSIVSVKMNGRLYSIT